MAMPWFLEEHHLDNGVLRGRVVFDLGADLRAVTNGKNVPVMVRDALPS